MSSSPHLQADVRLVQRRPGRPRKFAEPSQAATLTLPLRVIQALSAIDPDLGRAIVRVVQPETSPAPQPPVELATFGRRAVIVVRSCRTLERRIGIDLVPMSDGRALISFEHPMTTEAIELVIADVLEDPQLGPSDRAVFSGISEILRSARRSSQVAVRERKIVVLEGVLRRRKSPARAESKRRERRR